MQKVRLRKLALRQRIPAVAQIVHRLLDILPQTIDRRHFRAGQSHRADTQHRRYAKAPCDRSAGDRAAAARHVQSQLTRDQQRKRQRIESLAEQRKQQPEYADERRKPAALPADRIPRQQSDEHRRQQRKRPYIPLGGCAGKQRETAFVHRIPSVKHGVEPRTAACNVSAEPGHDQHSRNGCERQQLRRRNAFRRKIRRRAAQCAERSRRKHGSKGRRAAVPQPLHGQQRTAQQQCRQQRHPSGGQIWICTFAGSIPPNLSLLHRLLL